MVGSSDRNYCSCCRYILRSTTLLFPPSFRILSYFVHACGVRVVLLVHGALGICKSSVCTQNRGPLGPLHSHLVRLSLDCGRRREAPLYICTGTYCCSTRYWYQYRVPGYIRTVGICEIGNNQGPGLIGIRGRK